VPVNAWTVGLLALGTALATGLGALPFLATRRPSRSWLARANAAAAGFMLAATLALFYEGASDSPGQTAIGALIGAVLIGGIRRWLRGRKEMHVAALSGVDALRAFLIIGVMTVHSFAEGVGVGVSFGGGEALGLFITVAIAVHNIPEGLAISLVLVPRGATVRSAAAWSIFSSLPQPIVAVPAFLFVAQFSGVLAAGLGFAGGAMLWMVVSELVPEARSDGSVREIAAWGGLAFVAMLGLQVVLGTV
jgi:zinc transporter, ZIP family